MKNHFVAFTLNGEVMISGTGQENAFQNIRSDVSLVPIVSLGVGQSGTLNFGKVKEMLRLT